MITEIWTDHRTLTVNSNFSFRANNAEYIFSVMHGVCVFLSEAYLYYRAESMAGGFAVIRDERDLEQCTVTYTTRVDLKGVLYLVYTVFGS